jgi:hypothetical protein
MKLYNVALLALLVTTMFSCVKKDDSPPAISNTNGEIGFEFTHYAGNEELVMNTGKYVTAGNDTISITKFNYYISNIRFKKSDGSYYAEPSSYHLIKGDVGSSKHFHIPTMPTGTYVSVSFMIGVDSEKNTSGAQKDALDVSNGMFWDWSTGYIMAKLEGTSPQSAAVDKSFTYHIGGFSGDNSALRTVTFDLSATPLIVNTGKESAINIKADALKWFAPNSINIATTNAVMVVSAKSKLIADNYANMFTVTSVSNQ